MVDEEGGRSLTESVAWTLGAVAVVRKKWTVRTVVTSSQEKGKKKEQSLSFLLLTDLSAPAHAN